MTTTTVVQVEGRDLKLSNLDKVLFPSVGLTKAGVIDYYSRIAPYILPHLKDRPLTLKRYPQGVSEDFFYEKRCPSHRPSWMPTARVYSEGNKDWLNYCLIDSLPALIWVANLASIEMHTLLARRDAVYQPTAMVFDLDPGSPATVVDCARVGLQLRQLLRELMLDSYIKTSGGKGLHMYVPLNTSVTYDDTKPLARALAGLMEERNPIVTSNMRKDARTNKVFIDWSQNDEHKTTVCVYSMRARERPSVSTPLEWEEVERLAQTGDADAVTFLTEDAISRARRMGDLFEPALKQKQRLRKYVP